MSADTSSFGNRPVDSQTGNATPELVFTADGTPLKVSLARARRRAQIKALLLVAPLLLFIVVTFMIPVFNMLFRSVDNPVVAKTLHRTVPLLAEWNEKGSELPDEAVFAALREDFVEAAKAKTVGKPGVRLNFEKAGFSSLFRKTARKAKTMEPPFQEAFVKADKKWANLDYWRVMKRESRLYTDAHYLDALDMKYNEDSERVMKNADSRIHFKIFGRTLWMSTVITVLCLLLAYPVAYLLSILPSRTSNLLMIMVLLPFWTSLLVRTSAWIALLQQEGVINSMLVYIGIIGDDGRLAMIHNQTGTIIAMVHVLLPFMVLPLYSVMKTIPPSYMRAARSLGANPYTAFVRVYMPNTVPGIGAGAILVFILAIGYYITPALVGGQSGTMISNIIAGHLQKNWGLAAALGSLLLLAILVLYAVYDRIVGIDNMKLG